MSFKNVLPWLLITGSTFLSYIQVLSGTSKFISPTREFKSPSKIYSEADKTHVVYNIKHMFSQFFMNVPSYTTKRTILNFWVTEKNIIFYCW